MSRAMLVVIASLACLSLFARDARARLDAGKLPSAQDIAASPNKAWVLAQFTPLLGSGTSCVVTIQPVTEGAKSKPIRWAPWTGSIPDSWISPNLYDEDMYFHPSKDAAKQRIAVIMLAPVEPGKYRLTEYNTMRTEGTLQTSLNAKLDREFEAAAGKVTYLGSFSSRRIEHPPGEIIYGESDEIAGRLIDNLEAVVSILDIAEASLGRACADRMMKAGYIDSPAFRAAEQQRMQQAKSQRLFPAVLANDMDKVRSLLGEGLDVNVQDIEGRTPAYVAAASGALTVLEFLVENGADINIGDVFGRTPLLISSKSIRSGRHSSTLIRSERYISSERISSEHLAVAEFLIGKGANVGTQDKDGITALYRAVVADALDLAKALLDHGAKPSIPTIADETPLHVAVRNASKEMVELLISSGADLSANYSGFVAYDPKSGTGFVQEEKGTPLHVVAYGGRVSVAELLIARGAAVNISNDDGRTPLHLAAMEGEPAMVELLLAKGADVNAKDKKGKTPLRLARDKKREEIASLLRAHGAKD